MEQNTKLKFLLFFVVVLAGIKFGLLPVVQWQGETMEEISAIERRNAKAEALLSNQQQLFMNLANKDKAYKALASQFSSFADSSSFRLETRIMFDQILKMDKLNTKRFFWRGDEDEQVSDNLYSASFNATIYGKVKDFAMLQSKLANNYPAYRINNMSGNLSNHTDKSAGQIEVTVTIEAFYYKGAQ